MMRQSHLFAILATCTTLAGSAAQADGLQSAAFVAGWQEPKSTVIVGLSLTLDEGWKTYWRAPGVAGFPPNLDFSNSQNVAAVEVIWPAPDLHGSDDYATLGYDGRVTIPIRVTPKTAAPVTLNLSANIGVCKDICVPIDFTLSDTVIPAKRRDPNLVAAMAAAPFPIESTGYPRMTCAFDMAGRAINIDVVANVPKLGEWERIVVEYPHPAAWIEMDATQRDAATLLTRATLMADHTTPVVLDRSQLRITLLGPGQAIEQQGCSK